MRNRLLVFVSFLLVLASCTKDENKVYFEGGTAPVLTATTPASNVLTLADSAKTFIKLSWTNPDYRFNTGISSQDVNYVLQVDTTGANFSSPLMQEVAISKDLEKTFSEREFNAVLTKLNVAENVPHNIEMRLKASLGSGAVPLYSNVIKLTVTPYLDVAVPVPSNGNLWIVGNATAAGWDNPIASPYDVSQKFTKVSSTIYELTLPMPGGGGYKLLQDNGNWATQYHMIDGGTWDAGSFEQKDSDPQFPGPPSAGTYKITMNFKTGKYTVVKQ